MVRKAAEKDIARIAEILVFVKRLKFWPIFQDDGYYFDEMNVLATAQAYAAPERLSRLWVYDDGVVKGVVRIEGAEVVELYVDYFFQNQGVGAALLEYAKARHGARHLWALEKNADAIRFYQRHGFHLTESRRLEEGTSEYLVKMEL